MKPVPEEQHKEMRSAQGRQFVEAACEQLYFCALQCRADGAPWPVELDDAHALLWEHLERDEEERRRLVGEPER